MSAKTLDKLLIEMGGLSKGLGEAFIKVQFGILGQFHSPRGSMIGSAHMRGMEGEGGRRTGREVEVDCSLRTAGLKSIVSID